MGLDKYQFRRLHDFAGALHHHSMGVNNGLRIEPRNAIVERVDVSRPMYHSISPRDLGVMQIVAEGCQLGLPEADYFTGHCRITIEELS